MPSETKAYFRGIEKKIIELINESNHSIKIAMAWFTNNDIKDCLINVKTNNPKIQIQIVVDDNWINDKYFLNYKEKFENVGIEIMDKATKRFLHSKFLVIDGKTTLIGSYNYSKKANINLEHIGVIKCPDFSSNHLRIFNFITDSNYIDENIKLLYEFPKFTQKILSTYYSFNKIEYRKYKDKIEIGDCFTHENGIYDEIKYYPGLIFNPCVSKIGFEKPENSEFQIPIKKEMIKSWTEGRNENLIIESYRGDEENYHLINGELEKNRIGVENYFKRKMEKTFKYIELKKLIESKVDIILEDDLWLNNFEPFLKKEQIEILFEKLEKIEEKNWW